MIKLYQFVGTDPEIGKKLEGWRDLLKSGNDALEHLAEMRELCSKVVGEMYPNEEGND